MWNMPGWGEQMGSARFVVDGKRKEEEEQSKNQLMAPSFRSWLVGPVGILKSSGGRLGECNLSSVPSLEESEA